MTREPYDVDAQNAEAASITEWLYTEDETERDIERAAFYSKQSDKNLIVAGMYAARVVGRYERNGSKAIAERSGRSVRSVENWAHAYTMLVFILEFARFEGNFEVRNYWREFTPTHFWTLWDKASKYDFSMLDCHRYLKQMLDYRINGEAWSADVLAQEIEAHMNKSGTVATWKFFAPKVRDLYRQVMALSDAPDSVRKWLNVAPKEVRQA